MTSKLITSFAFVEGDVEQSDPDRAVDRIDKKIIQALQIDGKMTVAELAEKVGLSQSPCARRIRNLERDGIIKGYVAVVDQTRVACRSAPSHPSSRSVSARRIWTASPMPLRAGRRSSTAIS